MFAKGWDLVTLLKSKEGNLLSSFTGRTSGLPLKQQSRAPAAEVIEVRRLDMGWGVGDFITNEEDNDLKRRRELCGLPSL